MRIQPISTNYYQKNTKQPKFGYSIYKPNTLLHRMNPVISFMDNLFDKSVLVSRCTWREKSPQIANYIKEIKTLGWQKSPNIMWDINKDNRQKYVIIMHGLSHNISSLQELYSHIIQKTDFAILAPEYSGLMSVCKEGTYLDPKNLLKDVKKTLKYLKNKGIEDKNIYILGHSFGGFVATELAEQNKNLGGLILVSTTDSFKHRTNSIQNGYTEYTPQKVRKIITRSPLARLFLASIFSTKKHLKKVKIPVDFIHSEEDKLVELKEVQKLASKSKQLKTFTVLEKSGHKMDEDKIDAIVKLLNSK